MVIMHDMWTGVVGLHPRKVNHGASKGSVRTQLAQRTYQFGFF